MSVQTPATLVTSAVVQTQAAEPQLRRAAALAMIGFGLVATAVWVSTLGYKLVEFIVSAF
jgi:hypothetical protein